ncbi:MULTISPECIES: hypothetical protein [Kitasatospora]|nr:hypothetical protein [Kitasatospora sp. GP30]MDH6143267.1 hypothetical protein [Kitasatospora sp. GP30]
MSYRIRRVRPEDCAEVRELRLRALLVALPPGGLELEMARPL